MRPSQLSSPARIIAAAAAGALAASAAMAGPALAGQTPGPVTHREATSGKAAGGTILAVQGGPGFPTSADR